MGSGSVRAKLPKFRDVCMVRSTFVPATIRSDNGDVHENVAEK